MKHLLCKYEAKHHSNFRVPKVRLMERGSASFFIYHRCASFVDFYSNKKLTKVGSGAFKKNAKKRKFKIKQNKAKYYISLLKGTYWAKWTSPLQLPVSLTHEGLAPLCVPDACCMPFATIFLTHLCTSSRSVLLYRTNFPIKQKMLLTPHWLVASLVIILLCSLLQ